MENAWRTFFDQHAVDYDRNVFTQNTAAEVAFLREVLDLHRTMSAAGVAGADGEHGRPMHLLDIGCGTGRHAVALAALGHLVTGVDLSPAMLEQARQRGLAAGPDVAGRLTFIECDARNFVRESAFDAAMCLCEGAVCLHDAAESQPEPDLRLFEKIARSLRPGGRFVVTALSASRMLRQFTDADVAAGRFDVQTLSERSEVDSIPGIYLSPEQAGRMRERGYTPPEMRMMLTWAGFEVLEIMGGTAGDWGHRPLRLDEMELMVVARRRG